MAEGYLLLYFCGSTFITFLIATTVLIFFSKDKMSRLAGFVAIKPVLTYIISFWTWYFYPWWSSTLDWTPWFVIHLLVEFFILSAIVFGFRGLFKDSHRLPWLFVGLDFFRWGSVLFLLSDFGFLNSAYIAYFVLFPVPILYAILALIFSVLRGRGLQAVHEGI